MIKLVRVFFLCSAFTCGMTGVVSAQWYPPVRDPNATYTLPGTDEFISGRGGANPSYGSMEQQSGTAPAATKRADHPTGAQMQRPTGG
jgi:hypothetical protein